MTDEYEDSQELAAAQTEKVTRIVAGIKEIYPGVLEDRTDQIEGTQFAFLPIPRPGPFITERSGIVFVGPIIVKLLGNYADFNNLSPAKLTKHKFDPSEKWHSFNHDAFGITGVPSDQRIAATVLDLDFPTDKDSLRSSLKKAQSEKERGQQQPGIQKEVDAILNGL